ncbi:MAG: hypothetical protein AAFZ65_10920 [Planctomycetota bacterium]
MPTPPLDSDPATPTRSSRGLWVVGLVLVILLAGVVPMLLQFVFGFSDNFEVEVGDASGSNSASKVLWVQPKNDTGTLEARYEWRVGEGEGESEYVPIPFAAQLVSGGTTSGAPPEAEGLVRLESAALGGDWAGLGWEFRLDEAPLAWRWTRHRQAGKGLSLGGGMLSVEVSTDRPDRIDHGPWVPLPAGRPAPPGHIGWRSTRWMTIPTGDAFASLKESCDINGQRITVRLRFYDVSR